MALRDGVLFAKLRGYTHAIMKVNCLEMSIIAPKKVSIYQIQETNRPPAPPCPCSVPTRETAADGTNPSPLTLVLIPAVGSGQHTLIQFETNNPQIQLGSLGGGDMVSTRSMSLRNEGNMERALASGKDRISALPDELLQHVMSFLLSRDAVRTCLLARRWSMLWKSVPALRIVDDLATDSYKFVDELLRLRNPAPLNVCDICDAYEDSDTEDPLAFCEEASDRIAPWLRYALLHQVRVLRVTAPVFPTDLVLVSSHLKRIELCHMQFEETLDLSSCQSLRHLNMKGGCFDNEIRLHISAPNLVSLKLAPESGLTPLLDSMPSLVTAFCRIFRRGVSSLFYSTIMTRLTKDRLIKGLRLIYEPYFSQVQEGEPWRSVICCQNGFEVVPHV
ncbi:hypothetical protein CFC21_085127 [Triticum aestivum]|uniref:F-box domain-containing protein n=2 Tax=Triticum aestivum TaxID=4565 RepID=A0A3B6NWP5_WHEAT|nr:hypothetical protein CFC21_085127 [Triticum aestivum]